MMKSITTYLFRLLDFSDVQAETKNILRLSTLLAALCSLSIQSQAQCCANNLVGDSGFEETFTSSEKFPNATISTTNNARTATTTHWRYDDITNTATYRPTIVRVDSMAYDGNQFCYIPDAPTAPAADQCLGNTLGYVSSIASCTNDKFTNGLRYVLAYHYVPFNKNVPAGGTGSTYPVAEFQSPFTSVTLYGDNGMLLNTMETAVAWSSVATSWKRASAVTPVINTPSNGDLVVWYSHTRNSTCGMLVDNMMFQPVRVVSADPKNEQPGSTSQITFSLNPVANVNGVPNIFYTVAAPSGYSISPTSGVYGQVTRFTLTINSGTMAVNGTNQINVSVADQVNTACSVTAIVTNPHKLGIGNRVWLDQNANGIQDLTEQVFSGINVKLFDTFGNAAQQCLSQTYATNFSAVGHNSGTNNFDAAWTLTGGASVNTGSGYLVISQSDVASRGLTLSSGYDDAVSISFNVATTNNLEVGDQLIVEYYNGTSWNSVGTISGMYLTWTPFTFSSATISGLTSIKDIRFTAGATLDATELFAVQSLLITSTNCSEITTTTDASGRYWFSGLAGLQGNESYEIRIDTNQSQLAGLVSTITGGGTSATDNNGSLSSTYVSSGIITTPQSGWDSTFDFGFIGYSLGNRVWWDNDNDGVIDVNEHGISGVSLSLLNATGTAIATTTTNTQGFYTFYGLLPGDYQVAVTSILTSGILDGATISSSTNATQDTDINNDGAATDPVGVTAISFTSISGLITLGGFMEPTAEQEEDMITNQPDNQSNLSVDFGFVPPTTAAGNFVFHDVNNDGDYDAGTDSALANIMMVLMTDLNGDGTPETATDSIQTAANGNYIFDGLGAGTYQIVVSSSNFLIGGPLSTGTATSNGSSGDAATDMNSEGMQSGIFNVAPNSENTTDANDDALVGIDDDANFSFDFGFYGNSGGPVPVEFISFVGNRIDNDVDLDWSTATETSSAYFQIERSEDAIDFTAIGFVKSSGYSQHTIDYHFRDSDAPQNRLFYRIKQVDINGKFEYSNLVTVGYNTVNIIKIYPVPSENTLNIKVKNDGNANQVTITDMNGSIVIQQQFSQSIKLDLTELRAGMYIVNVNGTNKRIQKL